MCMFSIPTMIRLERTPAPNILELQLSIGCVHLSTDVIPNTEKTGGCLYPRLEKVRSYLKSVFNSRGLPAHPDPPDLCVRGSAVGLPIYRLFNRILDKQPINKEAEGRLKMCGGGGGSHCQLSIPSEFLIPRKTGRLPVPPDPRG